MRRATRPIKKKRAANSANKRKIERSLDKYIKYPVKKIDKDCREILILSDNKLSLPSFAKTIIKSSLCLKSCVSRLD